MKVRYKQTVLGFLWAVIHPVVMMCVFTLVFHRIGGLSGGGVPYPVFSFVALLPWYLFQNSLSRASLSIVAESNLLSKVYFPRLLIPLSAMSTACVDFLIGLGVLLLLFVYYEIALTWRVALFPVLTAYALFASLSVSVWLSALNARFRDIGHAVPFVLRVWLFVTPVAYPSEKLISQFPSSLRWVYHLNPMCGVVDGFRWALLPAAQVNLDGVLLSLCFILLLFITGLYYFQKTERTIVDLI